MSDDDMIRRGDAIRIARRYMYRRDDTVANQIAAIPAADTRAEALKEAAALMNAAAEKCRSQFTYPPKTQEQRDWQTGAIIHSNAARAILALIPENKP